MSPIEARNRPVLALVTTLLVQAFGTFCVSAPSVLAPAVAPSLGFAPERVGLFVGLVYLSAMLTGLWSGRGVARFGAVGLSQWAMATFAIGMLGVTTGNGLVMLAVALLIGAGYGTINPAAAAVLNQHSPPAHRGMLFSIKQSGVPLGVAAAGLLLPLGLATVGWQATLWMLGGACAIYGLSLAPTRRPLEPARYPSPSISGERAGDSAAARSAPARGPTLARVMKHPDLRVLSIASFAFAFCQLCFMTFLVSFLNLELERSLALSAGVLAASQGLSTVGRIFWGIVADRWIAPGKLLGWLGIGAAVSFVWLGLLGHLGTHAHIGWTIGAALFCAATAMSWNGVFFAELAQYTTKGDMASIAGAVQFLTFFGSMAGPVVFSELIRYGVGYGNAFWTIALLPLIAGIAMLRRKDAAAS